MISKRVALCIPVAALVLHLATITASTPTDAMPVRLVDATFPAYPPIAQVAGKSGAIAAEVHLNSNCVISMVSVTGDKLFIAAVQESVSKWRFAGCNQSATTIEARFKFELNGENNDWTPTDVEMISPWNFIISTAQPERNFQ
jgi:outer membrane biosynthesis protein TonB